MNFIQLNNSKGNVIFDSLPISIDHKLITANKRNEPFNIVIDGVEYRARYGNISTKNGTVHLITINQKYVGRLKSFRELVQSHAMLLETIPDIKSEIIRRQNTQTAELIHNLTSLNTYNIQDLFALIPQQTLIENLEKQKDIVKEITQRKPIVTAETILRIIKNNLAQKVEFSVFEKTLKENPNIQRIDSDIRGVFVSILQIFIQDFDDKKIDIQLGYSDKELSVDYDSLSVSIYFILDNTLKYSLKGSKLKIHFEQHQNKYEIKFDMLSLRIEEEEINRLCEFGYRTETAEKYNPTGEGIGMNRINKTLKMNDAYLEICPRVTSHSKRSGDYIFEHNVFKIIFNESKYWT